MKLPALCTAMIGALIHAQAMALTAPAEKYIWANAPVVGGGFVSGIVTNPKFPVIYCRTDIGGAYRRDKSRGRWISISDWIDAEHWNYMGTESLALDAHDGNRVYIAAGMYTNEWAGNGAILASRNQGSTWQITPLAFKLGGNENGRNNGERLAVAVPMTETCFTWEHGTMGSGKVLTLPRIGIQSMLSQLSRVLRVRASSTSCLMPRAAPTGNQPRLFTRPLLINRRLSFRAWTWVKAGARLPALRQDSFHTGRHGTAIAISI